MYTAVSLTSFVFAALIKLLAIPSPTANLDVCSSVVFHCWSPSVLGISHLPPACLRPCALCPGAELDGTHHQAPSPQGLWLALGNQGLGWKLEMEGRVRTPGSWVPHIHLQLPKGSLSLLRKDLSSCQEAPSILWRLFSQLCVWLCVLLTPFPRPSGPGSGAAQELPLPGAPQPPCLSLPVFGNHHQTNISLKPCENSFYVFLPKRFYSSMSSVTPQWLPLPSPPR